eukprot:8689504-Pyramimonas_sp.AAC.1
MRGLLSSSSTWWGVRGSTGEGIVAAPRRRRECPRGGPVRWRQPSPRRRGASARPTHRGEFG